MQLAIITDTHFGWHNDSIIFHEYFKKFYDEIFFPTLRNRNIKTVVHNGDFWDRRRYVNFYLLNRTRIEIIERFVEEKLETHLILGNHDTYFRDSNNVNSAAELLHTRYPTFHIYEEAQEITLDGRRIMLVPWLNPTNIEKGLEKIAKSKAKLLIGHLAINGFPMDSGKLCDTGLNSEVFKKFDMVLSGHFHHANEKGQIRYLGAPYQLTIADLHEKKGFHILDTDTLELEFIENPFEMFYKFIYDDRTEEAVAEIQKLDVSQFTDKYVRLVATHKENSVLYEQLIDKINNANPADFKTDEVCDLDVPESVDNEIGENIDITGEVDPTQNQTLAIIDKYIDSIGMEVDKEQLKRIMNELYAEASIGMVTI